MESPNKGTTDGNADSRLPARVETQIRVPPFATEPAPSRVGSLGSRLDAENLMRGRALRASGEPKPVLVLVLTWS